MSLLTEYHTVFMKGEAPFNVQGSTQDRTRVEGTYLYYHSNIFVGTQWYVWKTSEAHKTTWHAVFPEEVPKEYRAWVLLLT